MAHELTKTPSPSAQRWKEPVSKLALFGEGPPAQLDWAERKLAPERETWARLVA